MPKQGFLKAGGRKIGAYLAARQADIEADRNSAILLQTVQDEAQQAVKYLNTLPLTERIGAQDGAQDVLAVAPRCASVFGSSQVVVMLCMLLMLLPLLK